MTLTPDSIIDLMPIVANRNWRIRKQLDTDTRPRIVDENGICPGCALVHELSDGRISYMSVPVHALRAFMNSTDGNRAMLAVMDAADFENDPRRPALMAALGMEA